MPSATATNAANRTFTLALGFGSTQAEAIDARRSDGFLFVSLRP